MSLHQQKQIEIITQIERQLKENALQSTTVEPVENFEDDKRLCLTSVHFPQSAFVNQIYSQISSPLKFLFPEAYFYPPSSLHCTIKNIRVIHDPPHFTQRDIQTVKEVFSEIIPRNMAFTIYPYKLLIFKNSLALMNTTDEQLDSLILSLDRELTKRGIADDKTYVNSQYFFSNMTLARFSDVPSQKFIELVARLSENLPLPPYLVDSVDVVQANAAMKRRITHLSAPLQRR